MEPDKTTITRLAAEKYGCQVEDLLGSAVRGGEVILILPNGMKVRTAIHKLSPPAPDEINPTDDPMGGGQEAGVQTTPGVKKTPSVKSTPGEKFTPKTKKARRVHQKPEVGA
jgi:hypothetical protein